MLKVADLFHQSIIIPDITLANIDAFFSYWHEFILLGPVETWLLFSQALMNSHFHSPIYFECAKMERTQGASRETDVFDINITPLIFSV